MAGGAETSPQPPQPVLAWPPSALGAGLWGAQDNGPAHPGARGCCSRRGLLAAGLPLAQPLPLTHGPARQLPPGTSPGIF